MYLYNAYVFCLIGLTAIISPVYVAIVHLLIVSLLHLLNAQYREKLDDE